MCLLNAGYDGTAGFVDPAPAVRTNRPGKVGPAPAVRTNRPGTIPTVRTNGRFVDPVGVFAGRKVDPVVAVRTFWARRGAGVADFRRCEDGGCWESPL